MKIYRTSVTIIAALIISTTAFTHEKQVGFSTVSYQPKYTGFWSPANKKQTPKTALLISNKSRPIYFCRAKLKNTFYFGTTQQSYCKLIVGHRVISSKKYEIYNTSAEKIMWHTFMLIPSETRVEVGTSGKKPLYICRVIEQGKVYGGISDPWINCTFILGNRVKTIDDVLSIDSKTQYLYPRFITEKISSTRNGTRP